MKLWFICPDALKPYVEDLVDGFEPEGELCETFEDFVLAVKNPSGKVPWLFWIGSKKQADAVLVSNGKLAIPDLVSRTHFIKKYELDPESVVFLGFKNVDELAQVQPHGMVTSAPYQAATKGVYLGARLRRVWRLMEYYDNEKLPDQVRQAKGFSEAFIDLVRNNLLIIRKVTTWTKPTI